MSNLPPGFVLDGPAAPAGPPPGFVLDPPQSGVMDFLKSVPGGIVGGLSNAGSALAQATAHEMSQPDLAAEIPGGAQTKQIAEQTITGPLYQPQGRPGKFGNAMGEAIGNPASYVGPGSLPLKVVTTILSSLGGEGGRQIAEGTPYEIPASLGGALGGGFTAAKAFGPATVKAAVPTTAELKAVADRGYDAARQSGLELKSSGVSQFGADAEQALVGNGFTGGRDGTAPKTFAALRGLQEPPEGAVVTAANLDALRQNLRQIAEETTADASGRIKPTPDAAAASKAAGLLKGYVENPPGDHILAGDAEAYVRSIKQANGDYAALQRALSVDARVTKAENATNRMLATTQGQQIKNKLAPILDSPDKQRGLSPEEIAQLQKINDGTFFGNLMRQTGRGAGVIPLVAHGTAAATTGGSSLAYSIPIEATTLLARYLGSRSTVKQAQVLDEMLRKRSPEYVKRLAAQPPAPSSAPQFAAIARALLNVR